VKNPQRPLLNEEERTKMIMIQKRSSPRRKSFPMANIKKL